MGNWVVVKGLQIAMLFGKIITLPIVLTKYVAFAAFLQLAAFRDHGGVLLSFLAQKVADGVGACETAFTIAPECVGAEYVRVLDAAAASAVHRQQVFNKVRRHVGGVPMPVFQRVVDKLVQPEIAKTVYCLKNSAERVHTPACAMSVLRTCGYATQTPNGGEIPQAGL